MDIGNLMQMANQLRDKLSNAQGEAAKLRVDGEAGGGLVRVVMNGRHEIVELKIDPKVQGDLKLLEDLVRAAVNQATVKVASGLTERMGGLAKDFGIDLSALEGLTPPK